MWRGRLSLRRVRVLIDGLPVDAALWRDLYGADAPWSVESHLLASVNDRLDMAAWQRAGKKNAPKPKPMRRPDPGRSVRNADVVARLERLGLLGSRSPRVRMKGGPDA